MNDEAIEATAEPRVSLADFLRESLGLTGTRLGCEHGVCGACTVLLDSLPVRSCLMLAVQADGCRVRTVESLAWGDRLHPLQEAFHDAGGLQCGFCTSGFLLSALPVYESGRPVSEDEIREAIGGNLCRCTGYQAVVASVARAVGRNGTG